jgi:amino acid transporter
VLADSDAALLEVVKEGIIPVPVGVMTILFACIAMVAITNTTLVSVVTQSRILYGMAREDVVPGIFAKVHPERRSPWVGLVFSFFVVAALLVVGDVLVRTSGTDVVARLATVTVVFLLFIYALVIVSALKLRGQDETDDTYRANTGLLLLGLLGNAVLLVYVVVDDPASLVWVAGLLALGVALFLIEYFFGSRNRPADRPRGEPDTDALKGA